MVVDSFRLATRSDAKAIVRLVNRAYRPELGLAGWTHESDLISGDRINQDQVIDATCKYGSVVILGIKDQVIVGCVHVEKHGINSHIGMLAVNPMLQGVGVGKTMLEYAENYANTVFGAEKFIMIVVLARVELIAFYVRRGYQEIGVETDYPLSAGAGVPKRTDLKIKVFEKHV